MTAGRSSSVHRARHAGGAGGTVRGSGPGFPRALAVLVAGCFFMENLDATIIAPAAPAIGASLGVAPVQVNVAMTAYLLTVAVLIPASGWLSDRFGGRLIFHTAIAVFTLASMACAAAPTLGVLTAGRVLQGVGGAMMVPVGRLMVLRTTAKSELIRAIAYLTWPALLGPVLAPPLGGLISTYSSWRWIFLINVPLGLVGLVLVRRLMPDLRTDLRRPFDLIGFVVLATGFAALVVGLEWVGGSAEPGGGVAWLPAGVALGLAGLALTIAAGHLRRARWPLLDLRPLRVASLRASVSGGGVFRLVISAVPFLLPLLFQLGFGWSAAQAGGLVVALFLGNVAIKPATTPMMRRWGIRAVLMVAVGSSAACLLGLAAIGPDTPVPALLALLAVSGMFRSVGFSAYNSLAFADVPTAMMTDANTVHATAQEFGAGLGVAVGALLVRLGGPLSQVWGASGGPAAAYHLAFVALAVLLLLPLAEAAALPGSAGRSVTGRS